MSDCDEHGEKIKKVDEILIGGRNMKDFQTFIVV